MRARITSGADGALVADPFPDQDSALVTVFAEADALLCRPARADASAAGGLAEVLTLERLR
jgi:molybdopterin molybdotransferase